MSLVEKHLGCSIFKTRRRNEISRLKSEVQSCTTVLGHTPTVPVELTGFHIHHAYLAFSRLPEPVAGKHMTKAEIEDLPEELVGYREEVEEHAELVEERLDDIPESYSMPDPEDMTLHTAKKFRLGIVFIDINDFSNYSARNSEKDVLFMLNMFIPKIMEGVRQFEGDFEKNTGDGLLAYFGAGEDDEETAETALVYFSLVQMALHAAVNPVLQEYDVEPISISGGASLGDTHISRIGINRMSRRTAVSSTANVASKLVDMADTNQYLVGQGVYNYSDREEGMGRLLQPGGDLMNFRYGNDFRGWTSPMEYYEFPNVGQMMIEESS